MAKDAVYDAQIYNIWTAYQEKVNVNDPQLQIQPYIKLGVAIIETNKISSEQELAALLPANAISDLARFD